MKEFSLTKLSVVLQFSWYSHFNVYMSHLKNAVNIQILIQ